MNKTDAIEEIRRLAQEYNDSRFFKEDPIIFPKHFAQLMTGGKSEFELPVPQNYTVTLQDVEIAAVIAAHLAWGRRAMIVRDIHRAMDEMKWKPLEYINKGEYKDCDQSLHRTIKWCEFASICCNLRDFYKHNTTLETLTPDAFRTLIYGQKSNPKMANKKIHMLRRWMVRNDGKVDLGIWKNVSLEDLIIPLDVHVHNSALRLGITHRNSADYATAKEITDFLKICFPHDPVKGDFALFAYSIESQKNKKN